MRSLVTSIFLYASHSSGLAKTISQGTVKGGRRQGRQRKRWEDKIRELDRPGVRQVPEGSGEQGKMEKTGCKIICDAPTTLAVKGLMMNDASFPALSILTRHWTCSVVTDGSQCFSFLLLFFHISLHTYVHKTGTLLLFLTNRHERSES